MMDKYQFGESPAAVNLVSIMEKLGDPVVNRKVGNLLMDYNHILNQLDTTAPTMERGVRLVILKMVLKEFDVSLNKRNIPPLVSSHVRNVFMRNLRLAEENNKKRNDFLRKQIKAS